MITFSRNAEQARQAFLNGDVELMQQAHTPELLSDSTGDAVLLHSQDPVDAPVTPAREAHGSAGGYIKSAVFGGMDGIVTTFAVVAAAAGANMRVAVVLAYGIANLIGDGLSMALGDYLSTKSEQEYQRKQRAALEDRLDTTPDAQRLKLEHLYQDKGVSKSDAEYIVDIISRYRGAWADVVMVEELGLLAEDESPVKNAFVTFFSFALFGLVPLVPYVYAHAIGGGGHRNNGSSLIISSIVFTVVSLFVLGVSKSKYSSRSWWWCGLETLLVGALASACAFGVGELFALYICSHYTDGDGSLVSKSFELKQMCA